MNSRYKQTAKTSSANFIDLEEVKLYLKIDNDDEDTIIRLLLQCAVSTAEKETGIDLLETTYENYREDMSGDLTLRRARFKELSKIEKLVDGVYEEIDSDEYEVIDNEIFGEITDYEFSEDYDDSQKAIKITFKTGFGASGSFVPEDLKDAVLQHVACLYENRGDFDTAVGSLNMLSSPQYLPLASQMIYNHYRVFDISM